MTVKYLVDSYKNNRVLIFDLDGTIYDEKIFLFKVYKRISSLYINQEVEIYQYLKNEFIKNGRKKIFNKLLDKYPKDNLSIEKCLKMLRGYKCNNCIEVFPWLKSFISIVGSDFMMRIITNGNLKQQKNKVSSLKIPLKRSMMEIVYADEIAPKPETKSFFALKDARLLNNPIYIGDSEVDRYFSKSLKIEFYNVAELI